MKSSKYALALAVATVAITPAPADARWKLVKVERVEAGKGALIVTPQTEWNRRNRRPSKNGEIWTKDGFGLNQLHLIGRVGDGETLFKDRKKKTRPMPKVQSDMLITDLAELFEASFSIEYDVTQFDVTSLEPSTLGGEDAILMRYEYALPNDALVRVGEARLAWNNGEVYLINFSAPELHYFGASIEEVRAIMDSASLN
ncbi:hypothetical protein [Erythrobacter crassostreae]|uniref:DUF4340 domain-containing protein n=1 Tax=Erythrobacter crassostreae TaxID=2828328 RepID=A0A9X1F391_9SPHN|nr:hypothetical protein [Erythrobacter crassostrea]MBV7259232.1 hypothetical protein [Erythrobacter crassostrea]